LPWASNTRARTLWVPLSIANKQSFIMQTFQVFTPNLFVTSQ